MRLLKSPQLITMANTPGGFSEEKAANAETQTICDQVKDEVKKTTSKSYEDFTAVKYRYQIVAGTNFIIKVHVGGDNYIHLSVFRSLQGEIMLNGVQEDKREPDPLKPF
ncbi:cystatin-A [Lates calcarifer]|uniref:Cystatin-B n=1 Tax=Lates calcarifer TaxID=8187 RepID=A0A4W6DL72_LATCA|nr:cystatin-A [Lates calcarifer]